MIKKKIICRNRAKKLKNKKKQKIGKQKNQLRSRDQFVKPKSFNQNSQYIHFTPYILIFLI